MRLALGVCCEGNCHDANVSPKGEQMLPLTGLREGVWDMGFVKVFIVVILVFHDYWFQLKSNLFWVYMRACPVQIESISSYHTSSCGWQGCGAGILVLWGMLLEVLACEIYILNFNNVVKLVVFPSSYECFFTPWSWLPSIGLIINPK